jgi:transcription-repair coupling factor (superfamily II helicase)
MTTEIMNEPNNSYDLTNSKTLFGLSRGAEAFVEGGFESRGFNGIQGVHLIVVPDFRSLALRAEQLSFVCPGAETLLFPAWDILPYDRLSPSQVNLDARLNTLGRLLDAKSDKPLFVITTAQALVERIVPRSVFEAGTRHIKVGNVIDFQELEVFLSINGYRRTSVVVEKGDFAIRGGLMDLYAQGHEQPIRLDFFGDQLESIRTFDRETQRTNGTLSEITLRPAQEIILNPDTIKSFRQKFLHNFGAENRDTTYEAISEGQRRQGIEAYLPLFYDKVESLLDHLPPMTQIWLEDGALRSAREFYDQAQDAYESRSQAPKQGRIACLPANKRYLDNDELSLTLSMFDCCELKEGLKSSSVDSDLATRFIRGRDFALERRQDSVNLFQAVVAHALERANSGLRVVFASATEGASERLAQMLQDHGLSTIRLAHNGPDLWDFGVAKTRAKPIQRIVFPMDHGFEGLGLCLISETDILGERLARAGKKRKAQSFIAEASGLTQGDLVVHVDHGIGRFEGLKTIDVNQAPHDCLELRYADEAKLFLPVENIELLSRYGSDSDTTTLDRLGSAQWQARRAKAKKRLKDMAEGLIALAASRLVRNGPELSHAQGLFDEFCAQFPFEETEDQLSAIHDVLSDFEKSFPMDRLICGDVGFGKTEVALRAAFVAAMSGHQVALICPTTLLARQHLRTFTARFTGWPLKIRGLSRLVGRAEAEETRKGLVSGDIDIVIGTHALLAKTIDFKRLGLVIIDEEQHFGVNHKERLKSYRSDVHVLAMSATPIPRTLQMALSGIRDLSIIATPPVDRLAVRTYVLERDAVTLREALLREKYRGGQIYYVVPRLKDLDDVSQFLRDSVPEIRFGVGHGQMTPTALEEVMTAFYEGEFDCLLSTTIVESGLDVPSANTLIVHRADQFGLAQLYQIRGRIGRSKTRAYAFLTTEPNRQVGVQADKRLKLLQSLDNLGAGFQLASHDLDLRGGGNLLGSEQSGHIREIGVELYQQMLEEAVKSVQAGQSGLEFDATDGQWSPQINVGAAILIPEDYIEDLGVRLSIYKRLSQAEALDEREALASELIDRFGPIPPEAEHLLKVIALKGLARKVNVSKIDVGPKGAVISFRDNRFDNPEGLIRLIQQNPVWKLRPDQKLLVKGEWNDAQLRLGAAEKALKALGQLLT